MVRIAATAEVASLLNAIESCTSRISSLVQTVKEYTYMDQAPVQNVDVVRSLETTLGILTHRLKPQINVKRDYQPVPLLVNTVRTELNQIWTNIIENAIDAMPGQGELLVRTFREDHFVVVEIGDNGPGIPPEIRPHIFDPFFTTKGVGEGTGLGPNTVQTIVRKHGGNVQVDSKPGDTRFQVWLPFAALPEAGMLGEISHYESHIDRFRPVVRQRWRENPGPGAGLWFDLGPHLIDQALHLFGLPHAINASFGILRKGGLTDDWAHVQLIYDHMRVVLHASLLVSGGGPRSVLHGTHGSWAKFGADVQERQLMSGMLPDDPAFGHDPSPGIVYDGAIGTQTEVPSPAGNQREYYIGIRDAILGKFPVSVPVRDAVTGMAILETSFESEPEIRCCPFR
jgi:hypothetical protein